MPYKCGLCRLQYLLALFRTKHEVVGLAKSELRVTSTYVRVTMVLDLFNVIKGEKSTNCMFLFWYLDNSPRGRHCCLTLDWTVLEDWAGPAHARP